MTAREPRIDIIRGFSIIVILVNHLTHVVEFGGLQDWMVPTPTRYGYSTASELFVILSGYMVGMVYLARARPMRTAWRRAARLWAYNAAMLTLILPLVALMPRPEQEFWRLASFVASPGKSVWTFLTLGDAPRLLDILQIYIRLMLIAPVAIWIHRRSPVAAIAASIGLYALGQILTIQRLSISPDMATYGTLDLLSWQMLFFVPMALGAKRIHVPLFRWLEGNRAMLVLLLALFATGAVVKQLQMAGILAQPQWLTDRYGLHLLRVAHAILVLMLYASALSLAGRFLRKWPLDTIGAIGRHSLDCYAAGVLATYGLGFLWERTGGGYPAYYFFVVLGICLTMVLANLLDERRDRIRSRSAALPTARMAVAGPSGMGDGPLR